MKDAYSFDRDEEGSVASFERNREAYHRIFERCGLEAYDVQAESGIMGGKLSVRLPRAVAARARTRSSRCENGDYAADLEVAPRRPARRPSSRRRSTRRRRSRRPA